MTTDEVHAFGQVITPLTEARDPRPATPLHVVVVSHTDLVTAGLTRLLGAHPDRAVVVDGTGQGGRLHGFDTAVYDLTNLVESGRDDLAHLLASRRPVVGLEPPARPDVAEVALGLGVADIVPLDVTADELLDTLERVVAGQRVSAAQPHRSRRQELMKRHGLSARELDILELVGSGVSNNEIAAGLYLSINSIKSYIRTAYRKIDVTTRSQAVLWAVEHAVPVPDQPED